MTNTESAADNQTSRQAKLIEIHGNEPCHICGYPRAERSTPFMACSYPHGRLPIEPVGPKHKDGFWTWDNLRLSPDETNTRENSAFGK